MKTIKIRKRTDEEYLRMHDYNVGTFYRASPQPAEPSAKPVERFCSVWLALAPSSTSNFMAYAS